MSQLSIIFTFLNEGHLRAGEHDNELNVVLPDHLPEVRNGVDRRILSGDELFAVAEPSNPTRVDVITIWKIIIILQMNWIILLQNITSLFVQ